MALSDIDRNLLDRCLGQKPRAWEDFVDRFMGLVVHVINHTAGARSVRLTNEDQEDFCAEVFTGIVQDDFGVLRRFRGQSSLATYLTVVARRIVVQEMLKRKTPSRLTSDSDVVQPMNGDADPIARVSDREEVARLLDGLEGGEAEVVRMYHLEGKSYQEISLAIGMPENSIGPTLSRAREKMRRAGTEPTAS